MRAHAERLRRAFVERLFDRQYSLPLGQSGAIAHTENMGIDGKSLRPERGIHYDIGGFAADAWQSLQRCAVFWHFTFMVAQ